jgi:hypothetical protein
MRLIVGFSYSGEIPREAWHDVLIGLTDSGLDYDLIES